METLDGKTILVTGGTGSFGSAFVQTVLERYDVRAVRVLSRDELKQSELRQRLGDSRVRYLIGDVRDADRLKLASRGIDLIVHAAALKRIDSCEYNPFETVLSNVVGTQNVITAAVENRVPFTIGLSSDKAVNPVNLYGATKLVGERLIGQAAVYSSGTPCRFASVRYGNVVGSRGSVVPVFQAQAESGVVTITDIRMTRFWITLSQAVDFVLSCLPLVGDGETFVPKIPSCSVLDLAEALAPGADRVVTGIRPGEKLHECLLTEDEARESRDLGDRYAIFPHRHDPREAPGDALPDRFRYASDTNDSWLTVDEIRSMTSAKSSAAL